MFDLSLPKLLVLAVIALVVFGPRELPAVAAKAGRALNDLRRIADGAKAEWRDGLGPEFADFDLNDLHPGRLARKHLFSEPPPDDQPRPGADVQPAPQVPGADAPGYDAEAT